MQKHKEILISIDEFETRVAILEDRRLVEVYIEEAEKPRIAGNIYLGRIKDILPGMEASFVDIGLQRNAFLFVNEVLVPEAEFDSPPQEIQKLIRPGQEMLVQVLKEPVGTKGARVTAQIALAGRKLVMLPLSHFVGVSKRLEGEERSRLHEIASKICPGDKGVIIRTAAKGATERELRADLEFLQKKWREIAKQAGKMHAPALVYREMDLAERMVRDVFTENYDRLTVDSAQKKADISALVRDMSPQLVERVKLYQGKLPLFDKHNVESQLETALKRRVWLRSGGYIAIDRTEALTSIDVNTAKYTGGRNLEQTIYRTNLEAAEEIARQLRLRDIGGIIVIDFIDMQEPAHREALFEVFSKALAEDRTKNRVIEISRLGLVEMTRKNMSEGIQSHFFEACSVCGTGKVLSRRRAAVEAFRKIKRAVAVHASKGFVFKLAPDVVEFLEKEGWVARLMEATGKTVYMRPTSGQDRAEATVWFEGSLSKVQKFLNGLGASN